jgi:hypothetical protein
LPRDGDPRARYAVIEDGKVTLKQIEYDVEQTLRCVQNSSFPDDAKQQLNYVYTHGKYML